MNDKRIILASDIHLCDYDWYGMKAEDRVQKFVDDLKAEYEKQPFEALLLLGDYSLDHWSYNIMGSYLERGISNTKRFVEDYLSQLKALPIEIRMIAGNHEMYGEALFHELTGYHREDVYVTGEFLFILMDTYQDGLDPTEHHDGMYTGADVEFIKEQMAAYPDKKVIICSHYLEHWKDTEEFKEIPPKERTDFRNYFINVQRSYFFRASLAVIAERRMTKRDVTAKIPRNSRKFSATSVCFAWCRDTPTSPRFGTTSLNTALPRPCSRVSTASRATPLQGLCGASARSFSPTAT